MGKIGWGEFLIILIIAVIVIGPDKLPELGKALGKTVKSVKKYVNETASEIADIDELKDLKNDVDSIRTDVTSIGKNLEKSVTDAVNAAPEKETPPEEAAAEETAAEGEETAEPTAESVAEPEPGTAAEPVAEAAAEETSEVEENAENHEIHV